MHVVQKWFHKTFNGLNNHQASWRNGSLISQGWSSNYLIDGGQWSWYSFYCQESACYTLHDAGFKSYHICYDLNQYNWCLTPASHHLCQLWFHNSCKCVELEELKKLTPAWKIVQKNADVAFWSFLQEGKLEEDNKCFERQPTFSATGGGSFYFFLFLINLFYFWLPGVFVAVHRLSLVAASRSYSSLWCTGFSLWWLLLLWSTGSRHAGFSSCGTRAAVVVAHRL